MRARRKGIRRSLALAVVGLPIVAAASLGQARGEEEESRPRAGDPLITPTGEGYEHLLDQRSPLDPRPDEREIPRRPRAKIDERAVREAKRSAIELLEDRCFSLEEDLETLEDEHEIRVARIRLARMRMILEKRIAEL